VAHRPDDGHLLERPADRQPALLLTVAQAAQRLGIGRSLLYQLIAAGALQSIHVRRVRRIPADEITAYVARQRHHST
jgi:excisionase family DNA binding protein